MSPAGVTARTIAWHVLAELMAQPVDYASPGETVTRREALASLLGRLRAQRQDLESAQMEAFRAQAPGGHVLALASLAMHLGRAEAAAWELLKLVEQEGGQ